MILNSSKRQIISYSNKTQLLLLYIHNNKIIHFIMIRIKTPINIYNKLLL